MLWFDEDDELPEMSVSEPFILDVHRYVQRQSPELPSTFHYDACVVLTPHHGSDRVKAIISI